MTSQEVTIEEVQTAILRRRDYGDYVSFVLSATSAIKAAGLSAESSLRFDLSAVDTLGLVPAVGRARNYRVVQYNSSIVHTGQRDPRRGNGGKRVLYYHAQGGA